MKRGGFTKRTVRDVPLHGKTVLLRSDFNVPLSEDGQIDDDFRIRLSIPTIEYLLKQDCKVIICAHFGRPGGKVDEQYSLEVVVDQLSKLLDRRVGFVDSCVGDAVTQAVKKMRKGQVLLLENLRFHPGEESDDKDFAKDLANSSSADYLVQDAFGVAHRAHASTHAVTQFLPSVAGLLLEKEFTALHHAVDTPARPMVAVLGGAKVSDKIAMIERLVSIADTVLIGGAMANTFLKYRGYNVGKSRVEDGLEGILRKIYDAAEKKVGRESIDDFIVLPTDIAVATDTDSGKRRTVVAVSDIAPEEMILDIGTETITNYTESIAGSKTVVWSGTLGFAEHDAFAYGSARTALALATRPSITSVIGGGDTADFVRHWDGAGGDSFTHVSSGGSASLDLIAGVPMPGIDSLLDA